MSGRADLVGQPTFLDGGGSMGALMRAHDWSSSPLGAPADWPQSLRSVVGLLLSSKFPMFVAWGEELGFVYNDAYAEILGTKHPDALGVRFRDIWLEIWDDIAPMINAALSGEATFHENLPLVVNRKGFDEDAWFTFSYSPVRDESGRVAGMFCACTETTGQVMAARRRDALVKLDARLREVADPADLSFAASELLGKALGACRVGYGTINNDSGTVSVGRNWSTLDYSNLAGVHHFSDYGSHIDDLRQGRSVANVDVETDPRTSAKVDAFRAIGIRAHLDVPVLENEQPVALLFVHSPVPRVWTEEEIAFARDFAERVHATVARRAAEQELRQSGERLRRAHEAARLGDFIWEVDTDAITLSSGYSRMLGLAPDALPTDAISFLAMIHADDRDRVEAEAAPMLAGGCTRFEIEYRLVRGDGEVVWLASSAEGEGRLADGRAARIVGVNFDVTERRRVADRLQESESRFRNMADNAPVMMWITDPNGYCTYLNRRWYEVTGQSEDEALGLGWTQATHPDDQSRVEAAFQSANAAKGQLRIEYRLRHSNGSYRWALDTASPRFDTDGEFLGFIGSVIDIDERREAEEAQRSSEARLRTLTNALPAFVWFATPDGELHYFNDRWYEYTGQTAEEALPNGWVATLHPDDVPQTAALWADARTRGVTYEVEVRYRRHDGAYRWYFARAEPLRGERGEIEAWFGTSTDIHARKAAEERLRELNDNLGQQVADRTADRDRVWRLSTDLMLVARFDATITAVNPAWTSLLGWSEDELLGTPFIDLVHPEDVAATLAEAGRLAEGQTTLRFENRYQRKDGSHRYLSWTAVPGDDLIHAVARDVTAEREGHAELVAAQEQLRQAQKLEAVGQLTGGVAHDFNNLLTIIRSSTDLLRRPGLAEDRRRRYVDAISDTVDRAAKLTGQLLAFARRQSLKPEVFDPSDRIRSITDMMCTIVGARIEIALEVDCEDCTVEADVGQFETALVNMAVNARDAMDGEGRLTLRVASQTGLPSARDGIDNKGSFVAISVADTGSGIPAERLADIFEPFFTTKEVGKGTGLGLSQVYGFAKQSGGDVIVSSEVGRGSTFTLYLPRATKVGAVAHASEASGGGKIEDGRGHRVLVVEDNVDVGRFSTQLLQDLGYHTTWASNADEALQLLGDEDRFDVLFSDVVMPGMSGVELGQAVRRLYPGLPVVLTSGYSHVLAEEGRHGFELLQKPYAADELSSVLSRVTRASQPDS